MSWMHGPDAEEIPPLTDRDSAMSDEAIIVVGGEKKIARFSYTYIGWVDDSGAIYQYGRDDLTAWMLLPRLPASDPSTRDDARAEDEAFDEVERLKRRLGQVRASPSTEPAGRALRERVDDDNNRVARLERNVDQLIARITMLEARLSSLPAPQCPPPYPGWPNPIITCGGGR